MFTVPVLIGIAVLAVAAVTIGVMLSRSGRGTCLPEPQPSSSATTKRDTARRDLAELARRLQMPIETLQGHEPTYRTAEIPKPRGGVRRLEIPDDSTKTLQRRILNYLLRSLNAHPLACGFEPETSIVHAALPHQRQAMVVKMDVRRFFESTLSQRIQKYFEAIGWNEEAADLLTALTTYNGHLPQGAPTSPRLSNLVNCRMDEALLRLVKRHKGAYSRYADDITISFPFRRGRTARGLTQAVRRILKMYGYTMHGGAKLRFYRQNQRQQVLGLVVNEKVALPRKTRRWLRAVRHHQDNGRPTSITTEQLGGWDALQQMILKQRGN